MNSLTGLLPDILLSWSSSNLVGRIRTRGNSDNLKIYIRKSNPIATFSAKVLYQRQRDALLLNKDIWLPESGAQTCIGSFDENTSTIFAERVDRIEIDGYPLLETWNPDRTVQSGARGDIETASALNSG